jgi:hypothetical protein
MGKYKLDVESSNNNMKCLFHLTTPPVRQYLRYIIVLRTLGAFLVVSLRIDELYKSYFDYFTLYYLKHILLSLGRPYTTIVCIYIYIYNVNLISTFIKTQVIYTTSNKHLSNSE